MRICIFTRTTSAHRKGKGNFHHEVIGLELAERGHELIVITTSRIDGITSTVKDNIKTYYLEDTRPDSYSTGFWKKSAAQFDDLHRELKFDIIISESGSAYGYLKYSRYKNVVPLIQVSHNSFSSNMKMIRFTFSTFFIITLGLLNQFLFSKILIRRLLIRANSVVCVSKNLAAFILNDYSFVKPKLSVIYNGIQLSRFNYSEKKIKNIKKELSLSDEKIILYLGRLSGEKGIDYLIRALVHIENLNYKLLIVGYGNPDYESYLKDLIKDLRVEEKVLVIKGVDYFEVPLYLGMSDILILPSLYESLGYVILESFACKTPVIATRVGGVPELIKNNKNGFLVPPKNPKKLAEKIQILLENETLKNRFIESGYDLVVKKFTVQRSVDEFEKIIHKLKKKTSSPVKDISFIKILSDLLYYLVRVMIWGVTFIANLIHKKKNSF